MNIVEAGNNLIAIQNRLLNEKQALVDQRTHEVVVFRDSQETLLKLADQLFAAYESRVAFLAARIAEIDAMIGAESEPMKMAAE